MSTDALHRRIESALEENQELPPQIETLLASHFSETQPPPSLARVLFDALATSRERLAVVFGELSQRALDERHAVGEKDKTHAAFTQIDRRLVESFGPFVTLSRNLMGAQPVRIDVRQWGAQKIAGHLDELVDSVASVGSLSAFPRVKSAILDAVTYWRAELARVVDAKGVDTSRTFRHRPAVTYDELFGRATQIVESFTRLPQASRHGFTKTLRDLAQGDSLSGRPGNFRRR